MSEDKKRFQVIFKGNMATHKNDYSEFYFKTKDIWLILIQK